MSEDAHQYSVEMSIVDGFKNYMSEVFYLATCWLAFSLTNTSLRMFDWYIKGIRKRWHRASPKLHPFVNAPSLFVCPMLCSRHIFGRGRSSLTRYQHRRMGQNFRYVCDLYFEHMWWTMWWYFVSPRCPWWTMSKAWLTMIDMIMCVYVKMFLLHPRKKKMFLLHTPSIPKCKASKD
jgi:hypothetical protein